MSILSNNQKGGKKNAKGVVKKNAPGASSSIKQNKAISFSKKPVKTGGTRGS